MKLLNFSVKNMHGYIDVNMHFMEGMSIIVGGNGSGKTSALSLLANVLRIDKDEILKTHFENIELRYETLERRKLATFVLTISNPKKDGLMSLYRGAELIARQPLRNGKMGSYISFIDSSGKVHVEHFSPKSNVEKTVTSVANTIDIGAKVTFVRLDRAISAIDSHGGISFEESDSKKELIARNMRKKPFRDPLDVVQEVTSARYVLYRNTLEKIKAKTYEELFRIHFSNSDISNDSSIRLDRLEKKITELEQRLSASESIMPSAKSFIEFKNYFDTTKLIIKELQEAKILRTSGRRTRLEEVLHAQLISRSRQIELLLKVFEQESNQTSNAYNSLSVYLRTLNGFLLDSKKELNFSSIDNGLFHKRINPNPSNDKNEKNSEETKDLNQLSSGEKQIVIMLTFLAFLAEPGSIFIVDEPELSLHLKWQRMLVSALTDLCPVGCQIILATHAPEIAGRARDKCIRLNKGGI